MSKQAKLKDPQQISFVGRLENQAHEAAMLSITEKSEKTTWIFTKFCKYHMKMETQKIVNLLNSSEKEYSKFATKKCYVIDSETKGGIHTKIQSNF